MRVNACKSARGVDSSQNDGGGSGGGERRREEERGEKRGEEAYRQLAADYCAASPPAGQRGGEPDEPELAERNSLAQWTLPIIMMMGGRLATRRIKFLAPADKRAQVCGRPESGRTGELGGAGVRQQASASSER